MPKELSVIVSLPFDPIVIGLTFPPSYCSCAETIVNDKERISKVIIEIVVAFDLFI